jgi:glycerophosphoryl diester phosphodiesterase
VSLGLTAAPSRRLGWLVLGVLLVTAGGVSARTTLIAAHRGGAGLAPENSLTAFRGALALGADALELDVHLTADGEVVVIHDATLERTTTGRGAVADATLAQLRTLHLKARDGSVTADSVPRLADVLDLAAPAGVEVLPEIKTAAGGRRYAGIEEKVLALLGARRFGERATIQSFDEATLRRLHELDRTQRTMLVVSGRRLETARAEPPEAVRWASDVGAADLGMDHRTIDGRVVAAAAAARVRLSAWTVNTEPDLCRMLDLGVDVVMSDHPDLALRLAGRAPRKP